MHPVNAKEAIAAKAMVLNIVFMVIWYFNTKIYKKPTKLNWSV